MITITNQTINLQAEVLYDAFKLAGNAVFNDSNELISVSGSIYKIEEQEIYLGSFNSQQNLSINIDNKENANLIGIVATAVTDFISELQLALMEKGGAQ